jgi:hypothetical protein
MTPEFSSNACAGFSEEDREALWWAARTVVDERGIIVRITSIIGSAVEWVGGKAAAGAVDWVTSKAAALGSNMIREDLQDKIVEMTEDVLWKAHDFSTLGLDPQSEREPWLWFNKVMTIATGATSGFFGLPGALVDLPLTTFVIMRSIAEIARANGEDLDTDDAKRACLQVLAFGGPGSNDHDFDIGYWTTRATLTHGAMKLLIKAVSARFGAVVSEKVIAQATPIAGAFAGGALNYVFMDYYQQMARVHFTLRKLERRYKDADGVRACFDDLVRQARARKKLKPAERAAV